MKEFICIVCPRGCHISVDDAGNISGYTCPRGLNYVKQELVDPKRTITSTVKVSNRENTFCPVKTSDNIKKGNIFKIMEEIKKVRVEAPIKMHQVIIKDIEEGVDIISTKEIK